MHQIAKIYKTRHVRLCSERSFSQTLYAAIGKRAAGAQSRGAKTALSREPLRARLQVLVTVRTEVGSRLTGPRLYKQ